ncbi:hypothetical protein [Acidomonas methanolica]|uniref:Uncharacterized protein n=2 Tax=Acidomonas methanolica TaxID=437 RepID=A0A023D953_ACIMT|nr:hypothetical protein [Acidomonas methanolica]TCS23831.1 hypothetical protein EDC31_12749 [Acidomonas methanolica]GAJ30672.1 hypothetical protein Amme_219_002 [Acidomonas methanolica NBRC 104435]GBQ59289.1 hypothetical protein AA0498_2731 [Acidomonas methanolica]GEL00833.1 hypothetical protein AME01nite_33310 [Acidomonas methanolica NBRC 104435]
MSIIEYRLNQIEARSEKTDTKFDRIVDSLSALNASFSAVSAKLDLLEKKVPSWWQAPVSAGSLIALMSALMALAKALHWF